MSGRRRRIAWSDRTEEGRRNRAKLAKLIKAGLSNAEIAEVFGTTEKNIEQVILRLGLQRYRKVPVKDGTKKYSKNKPISRRNVPEFVVRTDPSDDLGKRIKMLVEYEKHAEAGADLKLSDEDILRYRDDPVAFIEECVWWNGRPIRLFDYQKRWLRDASTLRIANKSTRIGFSFVNCLEAFWRCLFYPYSTILFVSINQERAKDLMDYIYLFADNNPRLFENIFLRRNEQYCEFTTGSRIFSLPNSPSGVRGIPEINGIWVYWDEVANFRDGDDDTMYEALQRNLALGGRLSMWSTPFGKRGLFYRICAPLQLKHRGIIKEVSDDFEFKDFSYHEIPATECPMFDRERIEMIRRNTDPVTFRQEYCCEFVARGEELFPLDLLESACKAQLHNSRQSNNPYYVGIDFAGEGADRTAIVVAERQEKRFVVRYMKQYQGKGAEFILPIVAGLMRKFQPNRIFTDATGMGSPITRELQLEFGSRVEGIVFTNQIKDKLIMNVWALLNDGLLELPPKRYSLTRELITQLNRLEVKRTPTGYTKYEHPKGYHDDLVWALALACNSELGYWSGYVSAFEDQSEIDEALGFEFDDEDEEFDDEVPVYISVG